MKLMVRLIFLPCVLLSACKITEDSNFVGSLKQLERGVQTVAVDDRPEPVVERKTVEDPADSAEFPVRFDVAVENTSLAVFIMGVVTDHTL